MQQPRTFLRRRHGPRLSRGVTLIELMVGMVIGLLAVLVIAQVALVFEGQKRGTTSGADAQLNGALALQTLQREIQMAGYGIGPAAGCAYRVFRSGTALAEAPATLAPVIITDGAGGTPDTLRIIGSGSNSAVPISIANTHAPGDNFFTLSPGVNVGNNQGDLMLALSNFPAPTGCTLFSINVSGMQPLNPNGSLGTALGTIAAGSPLFEVLPSAAPASAVAVGQRLGHTVDTTSGVWNGDGATPLIPTNYTGYLVNLGAPASFRDHRFRIVNNSLASRNLNAATGAYEDQELFPQVVDLQAVYGSDTTATRDNVVDSWSATSPTTQDGWSRVIAVRVALVSRSSQYEKENVTSARPANCAAPGAGSTYPLWRPDGSATACLRVDHLTDWQRYRYKVFEAAIPVRNVLWTPAGSTP